MPVSSSPVLIDGGILGFQQDIGTIQGVPLTTGDAQCRELFNVGGNLYAVLRNPFGTGIASVDIRIFKSTDGGLTWAAKDTANEPGAGGINTSNFEGVFLQGTKIYVGWRFIGLGGAVSRLNSFDTTTDTWTGQSADSPVTFASSTEIGLAVLSNTDQYIISNIAANNNLKYAKFSGGVWAGVLTDVSPVAVNTFGFYKAHLVDATDTIHLVYAELVTGVSMDLYYVQIDSTGRVGARTLLLAGPSTERYNVGNMCFQSANLVIPFQRQSDNITTVLIGTPLAAPVFAATTVDPAASTVPVGGVAHWPCAVLDGSGKINVFWATTSAGDLDDRVWTAAQQSPTFGAPVAWYKAASFPPPGAVAPFFPNAVGSPTLLPGVQFGVLWDAITPVAEAAYLLIGAGGGGGGPASILTLKFAGMKVYG